MLTYWLLVLGALAIPYAESERVHYANQRRYEKYDYVIVGAGSSGSVVASRLSENKNVTVLLIEAGGPPPIMCEVPLLTLKLGENTETNWGYFTEPQVNACLGLDGQRSFWSRYKALGGCSSHNFMVYSRGNHKDYDNWAQMGADGWSWKEVFPVFMKSEDNTIPTIANNGYHGTGGYLGVSSPGYRNKLADAFLEAGKYFGYDTEDYNGANQTGFFKIQMTKKDGFRCSTEMAYLRPAAKRPNLDILTYAQAKMIKFDENKRARSVIYDQHNKTISVSARNEIILSAGAIGSPQLLLLSGIGPKEDLEKLGIPVISNLPVGLNMQDHIIAGGQAWTLNDSVGIVLSRDVNNEAWLEFLEDKGVLTSPGSFEGTAFLNSKFQNATENWPDIQLLLSSTIILPRLPQYDNTDTVLIMPLLTRPKGRGTLTLRSRNPYEHPILDPKYLSEEDDLLRLVEGMKFVRKVMNTPFYKKFDPKPVLDAVPDCQGLDWDSEEYLVCNARSLTFTDFHMCCTNKMGATEDPSTVLDSRLRVKGVEGLRVVDASIMPLIASGNLNAVCIMIGEKAAEMIASDNAHS